MSEEFKTHTVTAPVCRYDRHGFLLTIKEDNLEVDYKPNGEIEEIRLYSEFFVAWAPVPLSWFASNFPDRLQEVQDEIDDLIERDNFHAGVIQKHG